MPRLKRFNRGSAKNIERQRAAWELFRHGATYTEIAAAMGIHRSHAHRLVATERDRLTSEVQMLAKEHLTDELSRTQFQIKEASRIVLAKCHPCNGRGRTLPDGPATLPGQDEACISCDGSGRKYSPMLILQSIDRIRRAVDQRAKLLGLYQHVATVELHVADGRDERLEALLAGMSDDELRRELEDLDGLPVLELAPSEMHLDRALDPPRSGYHA